MPFELMLEDMVFGGDALGHLPDGRAVFVPFGLPGEKILLSIVEEKKSFARGQIEKILTPSPIRIQPRCRHYGTCGGCNYQHLAYRDQLAFKQRIVKGQLQRMAGLVDFPVAPVVPSPNEWNYRNTVQFRVSYDGKVGYQAAGTNNLVEISECHLPMNEVNSLWPKLLLEPGSGIHRINLRQGGEGDLMLVLESDQEAPPEFSVDFPISVVFKNPESQYVLSGEDLILMQVKGRDFRVSVDSFFQVNLPQAEAMVDHVIALAGSLEGKTVLDAYSGVGLFSTFLAATAKRLIAIEVSESSCNDFAVNLDDFENVELYIDQAENVLPTLKTSLDLAVVDPPRAGLDSRVVSSLIATKPQKVIYVSCDPATLARDIKRFIDGGYTLKSVTPFDQFPQTYHIECVAELLILH